MKKILHVISTVNPEFGGPIEGVRQLALRLKKDSITVECVCNDLPNSKWFSDMPFKVYGLGPSVLNYSYSSKLSAWLKNNIQNYDVVIVNGIWQYMGFTVWRAALRANIPYFVFTHGMLDPWFKKEYPLKHVKKLIYWYLIEYWVLKNAKSVLFTCKEECILARESFRPYKIKELIVGYGISQPPKDSKNLREKFIAKYPQLAGKRILLFLSRIHEKKGCDLLIHAFAKVAKTDSNLHLVIAGPDNNNLRLKLISLAKELLIEEQITWPGMLINEDKWGAYFAAEVFCLPSHQENFGIVVAEALACSLPVLISNKVNIWREIEKYGAGIVEKDNLKGTLSSLEQWLSLSKADSKKMQEMALNCFQKNFEIEAFNKNIQSLLTTLKSKE